MTITQTMLMLKRSHELVSDRKGAEIRDAARNGMVVYRGTYRQCVAYARKNGLWYS